MSRLPLLLVLFTTLLACGGPPEDPKAGVQAAVESHLAQRTDLDMSAMDVSIDQVEVNGDSAEAQVSFRSKGNPDAAMNMTYALTRTDDGWKVEPKAGSGHGLPEQQTPPSMDLPPDHPPAEGGEATLPQNHPPVAQ